jgi:hypothetical protein
MDVLVEEVMSTGLHFPMDVLVEEILVDNQFANSACGVANDNFRAGGDENHVEEDKQHHHLQQQLCPQSLLQQLLW